MHGAFENHRWSEVMLEVMQVESGNATRRRNLTVVRFPTSFSNMIVGALLRRITAS